MHHRSLEEAIEAARESVLVHGVKVNTGHWQGVSTEGKPDLVTTEVVGYAFAAPIPVEVSLLQHLVKPNLPWAEDHFQERVAGKPTNPGVEYKNWPWWRGGAQEEASKAMAMDPHTKNREGFRFSHTYQERFWPKEASKAHKGWGTNPIHGIRYDYGDLDDVVNLLVEERYTRQAYLPIFFPEDTGAVHGGRIPCTIGYHFLRRYTHDKDVLHIFYNIRSCDLVRHFQDDVYMAARLCQWVIDACGEHELENVRKVREGEVMGHWHRSTVKPGKLYMSISSLHFHEGDRHRLDQEAKI